MARGRKKSLNLDEQLERILTDIKETEDRLKELKAEKIKVEEQLKMNRIAELDDFISSRGLSIEDVKEMLEER